MQPRLQIFISSGAKNHVRRRSLRKSWFRYSRDPETLPQRLQQGVAVHFVLSAQQPQEVLEVLQQEAAQHGDMVLLDTPEGYAHLWRKSLVYLAWLKQEAGSSACSTPDFVMHADDDSFVRLDLLLPLLPAWPLQRHYWGYIWDGTGARTTAPIRNPQNKSYMPVEQYALDFYPPFASGCGFVLSWDLVLALLARPLPDYRLLDPPFGIHLCGPPGLCVLAEPVIPVHDERVRPYRPLPTFRPDTLVQHYLQAEEMKPFFVQAQDGVSKAPSAEQPLQVEQEAETGDGDTGNAAEQLYSTLVKLGLLRR